MISFCQLRVLFDRSAKARQKNIYKVTSNVNITSTRILIKALTLMLIVNSLLTTRLRTNPIVQRSFTKDFHPRSPVLSVRGEGVAPESATIVVWGWES